MSRLRSGCLALALCACATAPRVAPLAGVPSGDLAPVKGDPSVLDVSTAAFGKPFLLAPLLVQQDEMPEVEYLKVRIVKFQDNGSEVALVEENPHVVYEELGALKLLATFPVLARNADALRIRCVPFLPAISLANSFGTSEGRQPFKEMVSAVEPVLPVVAAWGAEVSRNDGGIRVSQVVRLASQGSSGRQDITARVRFDLYAQPVKDSFAARFGNAQRRVGFFEVPLVTGRTGDIVTVATRWNLSPPNGPVTVRVTSNVPDSLKGAVEDGVAYWNKVLGFEALKIVHGADPGQLPERREIIVRWVTWDTAGFSVAKFQANPLTGEIIRAEAMVTSAFSNVATLDPLMAAASGSSAASRISWPGHACRMSVAAGGLAAAGAPVSTSRRVAADEVRSVTAHEVGHTLGLRHNFAGSVATEFASAKAQAAAWNDYIRGNDAGSQTASTVMDYLVAIDDALLGAKLRHAVLPYDSLAMQWGYHRAELDATAALPPFCTDGSAGKTLGCARYDGGANPLAFAAQLTAFRISQLPALIVAQLTTAQTPAEILDLPLPGERAARIDTRQLAKSAVEPAYSAAEHALQVRKSETLPIFLVPASVTRDRELVTDAGGPKGIAAVALTSVMKDRHWIAHEVDRLLSARPTPGGRPDSEIPALRQLGQRVSTAIEAEILERLVPFTFDKAPEKSAAKEEDSEPNQRVPSMKGAGHRSGSDGAGRSKR